MNRRSFVLATAAGFLGAPPALSQTADPVAPWPMSKRNVSRNSRSPAIGPGAPRELWRYGNTTLQTPFAAGADGTIYAAEAARIAAFSPDGQLLWYKDLPQWISLAGCALGGDGTLLVVSERGFLIAYSPGGQRRWIYAYGSPASVHAEPLIAPDGAIYTGSSRSFVSLQPNGSVNWTYPAGVTGGAAQASDGTLYFPSGQYLYALGSDGSLRWRVAIPDPYGAGGAPAVAADGTIYVTTVLGSLAAVNASGSLRWFFNRSHVVADLPSPPALGAGGAIYYGATDNCVYAVNPDGSQRWSFRPDSRDGFLYAPLTVGGDGTIYVGANVPDFYALYPDGSLRWHIQLPSDPNLGTYVRSQPVLAGSGRLLVGSMLALQAFG